MPKHANDSTIEMPANTSASTGVKSNFGPKGWNVIALCTLVLALALALTDTMTGAYILFAVLSVLAAVLIFLMNGKEYADE